METDDDGDVDGVDESGLAACTAVAIGITVWMDEREREERGLTGTEEAIFQL